MVDIDLIVFMVAFVPAMVALGWAIHTGIPMLAERLKPVQAGIYMYTSPWLSDENRYHPARMDRTCTLTSKAFWTVAAARRWAEQKHLKYLAGEPCDTVTTVAFVAYGDWEDLMTAAPYYAFPSDYGSNYCVWLRESDPYATVRSL